MIDDEFQLPVVAARYLGETAVSAERKRAFLLELAPAATRLALPAAGAGPGRRG